MHGAVAWPLAAILLVTAGSVEYLASAGYLGLVLRSRRFGLRTPATMMSDASWNAGHRAAAPLLAIAGLGAGLPGLALVFRPSTQSATLLVMVGSAVLVAFFGLALFTADRAAQKTHSTSSVDDST